MNSECSEVEEAVGCIVGAVVQLNPDSNDAVRQRLAACEGVDVHAEDDHSRLVITMEAATSREVMEMTEQIHNLHGVLHVTPVYQHCEEDQQHGEQGGWKWR